VPPAQASDDKTFDNVSGQETEIWQTLILLRAPPQPNITLEDFHGTAEAIVFPDAWARLNQVIVRSLRR
jgi:hypothetical protein